MILLAILMKQQPMRDWSDSNFRLELLDLKHKWLIAFINGCVIVYPQMTNEMTNAIVISVSLICRLGKI